MGRDEACLVGLNQINCQLQIAANTAAVTLVTAFSLVNHRDSFEQRMITPLPALAAIPGELPAEEAGLFRCVGVTVYNAFGKLDARRRRRRNSRHRRTGRISESNTLGGWASIQSRFT